MNVRIKMGIVMLVSMLMCMSPTFAQQVEIPVSADVVDTIGITTTGDLAFGVIGKGSTFAQNPTKTITIKSISTADIRVTANLLAWGGTAGGTMSNENMQIQGTTGDYQSLFNPVQVTSTQTPGQSVTKNVQIQAPVGVAQGTLTNTLRLTAVQQ